MGLSKRPNTLLGKSSTRTEGSLTQICESVSDVSVVCTLEGLDSMCFTSSLMVMLRLRNVGMAKTAFAAEADIVPTYVQPRESFVSRDYTLSC